MTKQVILVLISNRKNSALMVQKILTDWGCLIKTRLGLHESVLDNCSEAGLLFLEVVGEKTKNEEMLRKINLIEGVNAKLVELNI